MLSLRCLLVLLLSTLLWGCGSSNAVYPVRGKISFEGRPMQGGGSISLIPLENREGELAGGEIAADGTYALTTYAVGDGSMVGEFRVVITQVTDQEPPITADGEPPAKSVASVPASAHIPIRYADPANSPLRANVEAKSLNEIDFELKRG